MTHPAIKQFQEVSSFNRLLFLLPSQETQKPKIITLLSTITNEFNNLQVRLTLN